MIMDTIKLASGLEYYRVAENDGAICMVNPKTLRRYCELFNNAVKDFNEKNDQFAFPRMMAQVAKECDPQEVYFYEFNNYECMYAFDGDEEAIRTIINYFGVDVARTIHRVDAAHSIDYLLIPRFVQHDLMMLGRLRSDCDYYLGNGNRYAKNLWARDEKRQIAEMRNLLANIPAEYRNGCITSEEIDEYERKMVREGGAQ